MSLLVEIKTRLSNFTLDVAFEAPPNRVTALLGASGCGKSLTLRCIAGIQTPSEGRIVLDGHTLFDAKRGIDLAPRHRRVGLLFQNYALFPNMTAQQNILTAISRQKSRVQRQAECRDWLARFRLEGLERQRPCQLSGGQQQRVALARMLASEPACILLDEPFSSLDSHLKWQLELELKDALESFPGSTLYVSHDREEVRRLCDHVCVIDGGKSEPITSVQSLFESPQTFRSALLSGCENISAARHVDALRVHAEAWKTTLHLEHPLPTDTRFVGIRAHHVELCDQENENTIPCQVLRVIDDAYFRNVICCPVAAPSTPETAICFQKPRNAMPPLACGDRISLRLPPSALMPLR